MFQSQNKTFLNYHSFLNNNSVRTLEYHKLLVTHIVHTVCSPEQRADWLNTLVSSEDPLHIVYRRSKKVLALNEHPPSPWDMSFYNQTNHTHMSPSGNGTRDQRYELWDERQNQFAVGELFLTTQR